MEKDKHILPDTDTALSRRVKRNAGKNFAATKTIYGPDNEPMSRVDMEVSDELTKKKK